MSKLVTAGAELNPPCSELIIYKELNEHVIPRKESMAASMTKEMTSLKIISSNCSKVWAYCSEDNGELKTFFNSSGYYVDP